MAAPIPSSANDFIEQQLDNGLEQLEEHFSADVLSFSGPVLFGVDNLVRAAVETKRAKFKRGSLAVVLTTDGGYIQVVQRIVDIFRRHYRTVDFIIPNHAYSAGTVLVMSGNAIYMDYYSRLGPIDPQVENLTGRMVPALGYLEQYNRLIKKAQDQAITTAEVQLLVNGFDQAELYLYEQARELSIELLKEWLVKYKFKDWKVTETRKIKVTRKLREQRASQIAEELNRTKRWHVHGHGISMDVLQKDPKLKLKINDYGTEPELDDKIRKYHSLLEDYMVKRAYGGVLHTSETFQPYLSTK
jgi:hypothetical protein